MRPHDTGPPNLSGVHVLVVDDNPDIRDVVSVVLRQFGATVTVAASTAEALSALQASRPSVLLSDLMMPGEDGYTLIRRVRALPPDRGGTVPAASFSARSGAEVEGRARRAGFQVHVAKPAEPLRLAEVVARLARRPPYDGESAASGRGGSVRNAA